MAYRFEWDEHKARLNRGKHSITFDEASSVFDDLLAKIFDDESHSGEEHREIIVGHSIKRRLLLVCFVERPNERIRIISARLPTSQERQA
jgi:uncharacterized DUF497 family protein